MHFYMHSYLHKIFILVKSGCYMPTEDPRPREDLCVDFEFHPPWTWDSLDPVSRVGDDALVSQQSMKPTGGDQSFNTEGFPLVSISVQLLAHVVAQGRVLLVVFVFVVDVMVLLPQLLLSRCTLGCWAPRYHQLKLKRLLILRCMLWRVMLWLL
jgi:hypothetical protein